MNNSPVEGVRDPSLYYTNGRGTEPLFNLRRSEGPPPYTNGRGTEPRRSLILLNILI